MPQDNDQASYLERVERHFGLRRGGPLFLSPRDWHVVNKWQERGLPIEVVLQGINRAFDAIHASSTRTQRINSLAYCRQHIEDAWQEHRERLTIEGSSSAAGGGPLGAAADHLRQVATSCIDAAGVAANAQLAAALRAAASGLQQLASAAEQDASGVRDLDAAAHELETTLRQQLAGTEIRLPSFSPWA